MNGVAVCGWCPPGQLHPAGAVRAVLGAQLCPRHATEAAAQLSGEHDLFSESMLEWTRAEDRTRPDRICAWCFHPRNSAECRFAAKHTPFREVFGG